MNKTFRIVKIIDLYKVVVNAGEQDVDYKTVLEIFESGEEVIDPETNKSLGILDYIKARLKITAIFPKMCVCENFQRDTPVDKALSTFSSAFTIKSDLNVDSEEISGGYDESDKKIKVGDKVRKVGTKIEF